MKVRPEGGVASRRRPCGRGGDLHAKRQARRVRAWAGAQTRKDERGPAWAIFMGFEGGARPLHARQHGAQSTLDRPSGSLAKKRGKGRAGGGCKKQNKSAKKRPET